MTRKITVARGDGIGPEIMDATLSILDAAKVPLDIDEIKIGKEVYEAGHKTGIPDEVWESLKETGVLLKAPITTPQGGGYKSLNVTIRKTLGLFANVRPCVSYAPFVETKHPNMNLVIIRENEEDLYGGIEYRQTQQMTSAIKMISRPGCENIVRYAFEYAKAYGHERVTCMTKDNIMKISDGLFHRVFDEIAAEYPDIKNDHYIIDIGSARLATVPHQFDVVVTLNLYGDVISDIAAEITGSVGLCGSSNVGKNCAMFEAIHGSAPDIAGQGIANPSGLIHGALMMLSHIEELETAQKIHNAWLKTIEDGVHTIDIFRPGESIYRATTKDFARAVIDNIGYEPKRLKAVHYAESGTGRVRFPEPPPHKKENKTLVGVDVYLDWTNDVDALVSKLTPHIPENVDMKLITNRGVKVWPDTNPETFCTDNYQVRFVGKTSYAHKDIIDLLTRLAEAGIDFVRVENMYDFDGKPGYSIAQGE